MELEERSIVDLPDRCESCGGALTDAEKQEALERGMTPVLCATCAAEADASLAEGVEGDEPAY